MFPFGDKKEVKLSQNREKAGYEEIIDMNDGRINVLLLGTSGCGKSTLINAMLERIYKGDVETNSGDWEKEIISLFSSYMPGIVKAVQNYADKHDGKIDPKQLGELLTDIFAKK